MPKLIRKVVLPMTCSLLIMAATVGTAHSQTANGRYDSDSDRLIEVSNLEQLNAIRYDSDGDGSPDSDFGASTYAAAFPTSGTEAVCDDCTGYELTQSLNFDDSDSYASGTVNAKWATGSGWLPIGFDSKRFASILRLPWPPDSTGNDLFASTFDGNGYTISNLYINRKSLFVNPGAVGLFGYIGESGVVRDLGLVDVDVTGVDNVAGLVGYNSGVIKGSSSTGIVWGRSSLGGLVGSNVGTISDSYSIGSVADGIYIGGLVGYNTGTIAASYATGSVSSEDGSSTAGGLVGLNTGTIRTSYSTGSVLGVSILGGLVGKNDHGTIASSHAAGWVSAKRNDVGGLVGYNSGPIASSYATGSVLGHQFVGGLVGLNSSAIDRSYATGSVSSDHSFVGGLVGDNAGTINRSYATGSVSGDSYVGGLVGAQSGALVTSYATGSVSGDAYVGGLLGGSNDSAIASSYSTGRVSGNRIAGGLIGSVHGNYATVIAGLWDIQTSGRRTGLGEGNSTGIEGKTTAELQAPTGYTGIYSGWKIDLDNADQDFDLSTGADDYWDFGTSSDYPVLKAAFDGDGTGPAMNTAPVFSNTQTRRNVIENTAAGENVGTPVEAIDADFDTLTYTLGGADAAYFDIEETTGQLITKAVLDEETKDSYTVEVTATDPSGSSASITVTITVIDIDYGCSTKGAVADAVNAGLVADCEALLEARDALVGSGSLDWAADTPISRWFGVTVAGTPKRVARLILQEGGLTGIIPLELGQLSGLTQLNLHTNRLSGTIPSALGDLANLQRLYLHRNALTGSIPSELGNLDSLDNLWLNDNDLSGSIPAELGQLSSLVRLSLHTNRLSGAIPSSLGDLSNLQGLYLHRNALTSAIPTELGNLGSLDNLQLNNNDLSGAIPGELGNIASLQRLYLHYNSLSGTIPSELGNLSNLDNLWLNDNDLSGAIPPVLGNLNLVRWRLRNNEGLTGCVPAGLAAVENSDLNQLGLELCPVP